MSQHIEVEAKLEVDRCGFRDLCASGVMVRRIEQLNVYYDSFWQLATAAATFRVRFCPADAARVTLKVPESHDAWSRHSREHEVVLSELTVTQRRYGLPKTIHISQLPTTFQTDLGKLDIRSLSRVGWVRNTRYVVRLLESWTVELDRLRLPGGRDFFEVEIEHDNEQVRNKLIERVFTIAPLAQRSPMSKFERFRAALVDLQSAESTSS